MGQEAWKKAEKETDTIKIIKYIEEVGEPVGVRIHKRDRVQDEAQDYRFGVEVVTKVVSPCSAKEKSKKVLVQRAGETLVVTSELPLLNGRICSLVERLSIENDFMRQEYIATNLADGQISGPLTIARVFSRMLNRGKEGVLENRC
mmetsp:Transcript_17570/g.40362  ORF Transcript_17570/g.40362 Transcript_17570/m.40362 type:complete len:146 (+) Transcript_17570:456-893(+)